jgi:hypothetical protein
MPKLKDHLLPRIRSILLEEGASSSHVHRFQAGLTTSNRGPDWQERDSVFLKSDRIYRHQLARFNYTTYDVRRAQDVINPSTSHCDILLLANKNGDHRSEFNHPFLYARVLGVYHANVIYTGTGMLDYQARKIDFLWVRWFDYDGAESVEWGNLRPDCVRFPPLANKDAFGFVDPTDVLRGCHIIPAFSKGKLHPDELNISHCARDGKDWVRYYVNRYVKYEVIEIYTYFRASDSRIVIC